MLVCCSCLEPVARVQVSKQSQKHAAQLEAFRYAVGSRRPAKPHCSKELLNQRRVVDLLARQGCYSKAAAVQEATNGMEAAEMKATLAAFEAEVRYCLATLWCCKSMGRRGSKGWEVRWKGGCWLARGGRQGDGGVGNSRGGSQASEKRSHTSCDLSCHACL